MLKGPMGKDNRVEAASDGAIIARVLGGDANAFENLMIKYEAMVITRVKYHVPRDAIQDTVQEVFLRAYKSLAICREPDRFKAWLASIAMKTCYDHLRKRYRCKETTLSTLSSDRMEHEERSHFKPRDPLAMLPKMTPDLDLTPEQAQKSEAIIVSMEKKRRDIQRRFNEAKELLRDKMDADMKQFFEEIEGEFATFLSEDQIRRLKSLYTWERH
jgi:RNA polymerase sigma factor (sigma-70 family)